MISPRVKSGTLAAIAAFEKSNDICYAIRQMNTISRDLNLLAVFDAVAQTRSVTQAAKRLSLSQPAVSHALNRLRDITGDPLFVRGKGGLQPTARALSMSAPAHALLIKAQGLFRKQRFAPANSRRRFTIAASDYSAFTVIPALVRRLRKSAPHVTIEVSQAGPESRRALEEGSIDLSFWGTAPPGGQFHYQILFKEHYVGVVSARHPLAKGRTRLKVSLDNYLAFPPAVVSLKDPGRSAVETALKKLGRTRIIAATSQSFVANLRCLEGTDLIATLPARLCTSPLMHGLRKFKLPLDVPSFDYAIIWHRRAEADLELAWLRGIIQSLPSLETGSARSRARHAARG
jgi:DNA-binding transcriptional LysR family regulator